MAYLRELLEEQAGRCAVTGRELLMTPKPQLDSLSIDRIDPGRGYVLGNVRLITWQANAARLTGTDEDLRAFCRDVLREE